MRLLESVQGTDVWQCSRVTNNNLRAEIKNDCLNLKGVEVASEFEMRILSDLQFVIIS